VRDCVGVGLLGLLAKFYSVGASWAGLYAYWAI